MKRSLVDLRENAEALLEVAGRSVDVYGAMMPPELLAEVLAHAGILRAFAETEHGAAIEEAFVRLAVAVERMALVSGEDLAPPPPKKRAARKPRKKSPKKK